jgi:hypothetical protein
LGSIDRCGLARIAALQSELQLSKASPPENFKYRRRRRPRPVSLAWRPRAQFCERHRRRSLLCRQAPRRSAGHSLCLRVHTASALSAKTKQSWPNHCPTDVGATYQRERGMIDWRRGSWTGSLNRWVRREVREHMSSNAAAKRSRYSFPLRVLRFSSLAVASGSSSRSISSSMC